MRFPTIAGLIVLGVQLVSAQDADRDFSGAWRLNAARSDLRGHFDIPSGFMRITETAAVMTVAMSAQEGEPPVTVVYPLTSRSERSKAGGLTFNAASKWEGNALLTSVIVGGQADYVLSERWSRSRDGYRLTVTRSIGGRGTEVESTLEYDNTKAPVISQAPPQISQTPSPPPVPDSPVSPPSSSTVRRPVPPPAQTLRPRDTTPADYVLPAGTRVLLRLSNAVNTKHSAPGDRIYLQTAVPIFLDGKVVIPQGSYVTGTVTESERAGRVKGKAALNLRFDDMTLPNGVTRDFHSRAGSVDTQGNLDRNEGRITGEGSKGKDTKTVAGTTAAGTGIGGLAGAAAGNTGLGLGIGAAAGAVAGLAGILGSRGQDVVIPQGTTMEMVLDRELRFTDAELFGRIR